MIRAYFIAQLLMKLGHEIEILHCDFGSDPIYPVPHSCLPPKSLKTFHFAKHAVPFGRIEADVVYAIECLPRSFGIALLDHWFRRRPLILDMDDWELASFEDVNMNLNRFRTPKKQAVKLFNAAKWSLAKLLTQRLEILAGRTRACTVSARFLQNRFGGFYLPNGKDTSLFDPEWFDPEETRKRFNLSDYRVLMFAGTITPYKGLEDVLKALEILKWPDLKLVIVGGRNPSNPYSRMLDQRWSERIIWLPQQPADRMPEILSAAHLVVVPQRNTSITRAQCPMKLSEAMAMAKPVLATRVGDLPEILGDTGFLADSSSPDSLAEQIELIFGDWDAAHHKGQMARKRCVEHYSLEKLAPILSETLDASLDKSSQ